ncbi:hypothetical protein MRX96_008997 [Rhipicephalus microplus]
MNSGDLTSASEKLGLTVEELRKWLEEEEVLDREEREAELEAEQKQAERDECARKEEMEWAREKAALNEHARKQKLELARVKAELDEHARKEEPELTRKKVALLKKNIVLRSRLLEAEARLDRREELAIFTDGSASSKVWPLHMEPAFQDKLSDLSVSSSLFQMVQTELLSPEYNMAGPRRFLVGTKKTRGVTCLTCSVLTLSAISCDRFIAIMFPLQAHVRVTKQRTSAVIAIIWVTSAIISVPLIIFSRLYTVSSHVAVQKRSSRPVDNTVKQLEQNMQTRLTPRSE